MENIHSPASHLTFAALSHSKPGIVFLLQRFNDFSFPVHETVTQFFALENSLLSLPLTFSAAGYPRCLQATLAVSRFQTLPQIGNQSPSWYISTSPMLGLTPPLMRISDKKIIPRIQIALF